MSVINVPFAEFIHTIFKEFSHILKNQHNTRLFFSFYCDYERTMMETIFHNNQVHRSQIVNELTMINELKTCFANVYRVFSYYLYVQNITEKNNQFSHYRHFFDQFRNTLIEQVFHLLYDFIKIYIITSRHDAFKDLLVKVMGSVYALDMETIYFYLRLLKINFQTNLIEIDL